jgi:DNA-binding transcriptional MerR regulator
MTIDVPLHGVHHLAQWTTKRIEEKNMTQAERIAELEAEIAELKARMPKHSVPPAMIIQLEDLEDELQALKARVKRGSD